MPQDTLKTSGPVFRYGGPGELKSHFEETGLVTVDFGFPEELIERAAAFTRSYPWKEKKGEKGAPHYGARVQDAWMHNKDVRAAALYPPVLETLEFLYGKRPRLFQTLNFPVGTEQSPHSDVIHFNCWPPDGSLCGVWLALEDADESNGPLVYYPGSHKLPQLYLENFNLPPTAEGYRAYEKRLGEFLQMTRLEPAQALVKRGQAVIWAANLVHGGSAVKDRSRTRLSQVSHYFFEGSEFFWSPVRTRIAPAAKRIVLPSTGFAPRLRRALKRLALHFTKNAAR